ncbi:hypothetical protein [Aureimonas jatrophae]|uniref:Uncharacterized protein n=1 Tax=Aureimonas jatrophae TaxID=1166073 RepID=A0A1H0MZT3_9HYPH|nr:hypothetical protein [Aureimonas jatrophae]MBB3952976.1 hypothetical protein [Aureimonas jatrophae]SDO85999.1 hypothetical protein SAMN05192530_11633 [Aureimonas jatrophae]
MTNRYIPNEAACPVDLELLGLLLRSPEKRVAEVVDAQEPSRRAALAAFCFGRAHMRDLAVQIARRCSAETLRRHGGLVGELLIEQIDAEPVRARNGRRAITLARSA